MSSLFHCIPNGCARVVWQPYKKGSGIRYRYPGENWVYVDGDDYSFNENQDYNFWYMYCNAISNSSTNPGCGESVTLISRDRFYGKLISAEIIIQTDSFSDFPRFKIIREVPGGNQYETLLSLTHSYSIGTAHSGATRISDTCESGSGKVQRTGFTNFYAADVNRNTNPYNTNTCQFIVTKNGVIVHDETREECPEVEILDEENGCQLSETHHEIIINKLAWFERIEVRDVDIEVNYFGALPLLYEHPIPENYLIVYRALVTAPITLNDFVPSPGFINPWQPIAIIASDPNCPPPEYTVYCDCDCESCPDGTCAIECGDHICCNDPTTGKNITSIPIDNYCES